MPGLYADVVERTATPTLDNAQIYADKDLMHATVMEFTNVARESGGSGCITRATLIDKDDQGVAADLWILTASPTNSTLTINSALVIHDTDLLTVVDVIQFAAAAYDDANTGQTCAVTPSPALPYKCASGSTSLFGLLVSRGTGTYTTSGIQLRLQFGRDFSAVR